MLCLNFDFYIIPLTLLLGFLKQYVVCMLMVDRNVNPEDQVSRVVYSANLVFGNSAVHTT